MNPNASDNLKPCKPGETHNPNGRPKGKSFKSVMQALLDLECSDEDLKDEEIKKMFTDANYKPTNRDIISARMLMKAKQDTDSKSAERIINRVEGKPVETVNQKVEFDTKKEINIAIDGKDVDLSK